MTGSDFKGVNNDQVQPRDEDASESSSEASFEMPDALATGREKRSTAGNRLRDMLNAEIESEAIFAEDEQDDDFGSEQDLQDDLDSELDDASSGDEERQIEPDDAGEQSLQKQEQRSARIKKRRAMEAITKPKTGVSKSRSNATEQEVSKRRKSNAKAIINHQKRQSTRAHAVDVAGAVDRRLKQEALRKAKTTRAAKSDDRPLTQKERLEEAKITEADNVASLNTIVKYEEEKRISQKLLAARRKAIGPFIRFVSSKKSEMCGPKLTDNNMMHSGSELEMIGISLKHPMDIIREHIEKPVESEIQVDQYSAPIKQKPILSNSLPNLLSSTTTFISLENLHESAMSNLGNEELLFGTSAVKIRPYPSRPQCSLSGLASKYKDPKTGLLYGNLHAYRALRDLKTGTIPWNPQLKMYVPRSTM